jgi:hypothetical protein
MKKLILILVVLSGCSLLKDKDKNFREAYIDEYKIFYFKRCLKFGFDNSKEINAALSKDGSGMSEPILGNAYQFIDSLAIQTSKEIIQDSIDRIGQVAEGGGGRAILYKCICNYNSKELDALARDSYQKQKN